MAKDRNTYYETIKRPIEKVLAALKDRRVSFMEAMGIMMVIQKSATALIEEQPFTEEDCNELVAATQQLFRDYVRDIDMPGPDDIIDPFVEKIIIPYGLHGVHAILKANGDG